MAIDISCVHWPLSFPAEDDVVVHIRSYHELTDNCLPPKIAPEFDLYEFEYLFPFPILKYRTNRTTVLSANLGLIPLLTHQLSNLFFEKADTSYIQYDLFIRYLGTMIEY